MTCLTQELEKRILLRIACKEKNKQISGIIKKNCEKYEDVFTEIYRCIFGDYLLIKFNILFNPSPSNPYAVKAKKCILDYLDAECLQHYLDCIEEIILEVKLSNCNIYNALENFKRIAKRKLEESHPWPLEFEQSITSATNKYLKNMNKGIVKTAKTIKKSELSDAELFNIQNLHVISEDELKRVEWENWRNSKEFKDYCIPDEENELNN